MEVNVGQKKRYHECSLDSANSETQRKNKKQRYASSRAVYPRKVESEDSVCVDRSLPPALGEASDILYFELGRQKWWPTVRCGVGASVSLPAVLKVGRKRDAQNLAVLSCGGRRLNLDTVSAIFDALALPVHVFCTRAAVLPEPTESPTRCTSPLSNTAARNEHTRSADQPNVQDGTSDSSIGNSFWWKVGRVSRMERGCRMAGLNGRRRVS